MSETIENDTAVPPATPWKRIGELLCIFAIAAILLLPELFAIYRTNAFDTIPRDPYEPYLLHLAGMDHGFLPGSPFTYRILSVVPALIPLHLVNAPVLTNLDSSNQIWLNAVFANAIVSYASMVALSTLVYWIVRWRLYCAAPTAICGALMVPLLFGFTATYLTDPFVILYLFVTFLVFNRFWIWLVMLSIGVGVNEKIPLIFAMYTTLTLFHVGTRRNYAASICALSACGLYLLIRHSMNFPGYENQTDVSTFFDGFLHTFQMSLSLKGIIRNLLPILLLLLLAVPLWLRSEDFRLFPLLPVHTFMIPGLAMVAFCADVQWNVGRNVMHLFPIYLPMVLAWMETRFPASLYGHR